MSSDRAHQELSNRKVRDQSFALLVAGFVLIMPPVAAAALLDMDVAGLPFPLVYVFVVWMLLIAGAALLSRPLRDGDDSVQENRHLETDR